MYDCSRGLTDHRETAGVWLFCYEVSTRLVRTELQSKFTTSSTPADAAQYTHAD